MNHLYIVTQQIRRVQYCTVVWNLMCMYCSISLFLFPLAINCVSAIYYILPVIVLMMSVTFPCTRSYFLPLSAPWRMLQSENTERLLTDCICSLTRILPPRCFAYFRTNYYTQSSVLCVCIYISNKISQNFQNSLRKVYLRKTLYLKQTYMNKISQNFQYIYIYSFQSEFFKFWLTLLFYSYKSVWDTEFILQRW